MSYQIDVNINAGELDNVAAQMDKATNSIVKAAISLGEVDLYEDFDLQNVQESLKKDVDINKLVAAIDKISQISNNQRIQGKEGVNLSKPIDNVKNAISGNIKQEPFLKSSEEVTKYQKNLESLVKNDAKLRIPKEGQSEITTSLNSIISGIFKSAKTIGNAGIKSEFGGQELAQIPNILNKLSENSTKGSFGDIVQLLRDSINELNNISNVLSIKGVQRIKNSVEEPVNSLNNLGKLIELPPNRVDSRSTIGNLKSNIDKNGGSEEADILAKRLKSNSSEKVKQEILLGLTEIFSTISLKIKKEITTIKDLQIKPTTESIVKKETVVNEPKEDINLSNFKPNKLSTNSTEQTKPLILEKIGNEVLEDFTSSINDKAFTLTDIDFNNLFKPIDNSSKFQEFFTEYKKLEEVLDYPILSVAQFNNKIQPKSTDKKLEKFFTPYSPVVPKSQEEITIDGVVNNQKLPPTPYVSKFKWKKPELEKIGNSILSDFVTFIEKEALELKDTDYNKVFKLPSNKSEEFFKPYKKEKVRDPKTELSSETFYQQFPVKKKVEDKFKLDKIAEAYKDKLEQAEIKNLTKQSSTAFKIYNSLDSDQYRPSEPKKDERFNQLINDISIGEIPLAKLKTVVTELISLLEDRLSEVSYPLPLKDFIIDEESIKAAKIEPEKPESKFSLNPNKNKPEDNKIIQSELEFISKIKQDSLKLDYSSFTKAQQPRPVIDNNEFFKSYKQPKAKDNNQLTDKIFNSQIQPLQQWKLEFPKWWNDSPVWVTDLPDWWNLEPEWSSDLPVWWNQEILPNTDRQKLLNGISENQEALNSTEELVLQKPYNSSDNKNQDNRLEEILDAEIIEEVKLLKEGNRYLSARNQKLLAAAKDIENPWSSPSTLIENDPWSEKQKQIEGQKSLPADPNYIESPWIEQEKIKVESTLLRLKPQIESLDDFLTNIDQKLELIKRESILKLPQGYINKEIQNPWGNDKYNQINDPWDSKLETQTTKPQFLLSPDPSYQEDPWIEKEIKKTQYKLLQLKPAISSLSDFLTNVDQQIKSTLRIGIPQIAPLSGSSVRAKFAENNVIEDPWKLLDLKNQSVPRNTPQEPRGNNPNVVQQKPQSLLNSAFGSIADPWFSLITLTKKNLVEQQKIPSGNQPLLQLKPAFEPTVIGETFNTLGSSFDEFISHIDSQLKEKGDVDFPETIGDFKTFLTQIDQDLQNIASSEFHNFLNNIDLDLDRMRKSGADKFLAQIDQELSKFPQRKNIKEESTDIQGSTKEFLFNSAEKIWPLIADKPIPNGFPVGQRKLDQPVFSSSDFVKLLSSQISQKTDLTEFFKPYNKNSSSSEDITIDVTAISKIIETIGEAETGLEALTVAGKVLGNTRKGEAKEKDEKSSNAQIIRELIQEISLLIAKKDFKGAKELAGEGNLAELSDSKAEYQQIRISKAEQKDIFEQASQKANVIKNLVTSKVSTAKEIGQISSKDLFGDNFSKVSGENSKKAELLIDKVNQWLENEAEKFDNEILNTNLSLAKKEAELGNELPLKNIPLNEESYRDAQITQNRVGKNQLNSQRRLIDSELSVAMTTLGIEQEALLVGIIKKIREQKTKINSPEQLGSQEIKNLETSKLKSLENKATNKLSNIQGNRTPTDNQAIKELVEKITLLIAKKNFTGAKELAGEGNLAKLSGSKSEYQQIRIEKAEQKDIFEQAKQRADILKNLVTSGVSTAKNIGQVNSKDLFGENLGKVSEENYGKAKLLIDKVNQWLEKETERFNNEIINTNLSVSKKEAELGNQLPLKNIPLNEGSYRDVQIAQNKEGETQLKSQRKKLAAELAVAVSTLGSEQKELIAGVLAKIREQKTKVNSPEQLGSQKTKDLETLELKKLENKANNRIEGFKDSGGSTNALRDLQAAQASISQFVRELKDLVAGFIEVSSAVNKEVIKLSVANNGNLAQTEQDIKLATDSAKRFGGSVSGYLKDLAGIKIADQRTIDRSGSLSNNRYTDGDVKSLLSGLRSAYAVNQLNGEQQDGASNAVLQILSKGKVQAEELRGQLGDRLNGAVNLFAQALGISTAQLDRRLKEGSILDLEVFKFGRLLEQNYSKAAEKPTLIRETTAVQGNVKDFATLATQPLAGIATISAQFVNQMADGFKSNASLFTIATIPIGLLLAQGISGGVANAFTKSSFVAPIVSALGSSFKANLGTLKIVGGGLGVAVAASSILGTSGLDQTISKLGDKIKDLVDWAAGLTKNGLTETNKLGKNIGVDAAFGILPLAAVISPITSYIANGLSPTFDRIKESFSGSNKLGSAAPQKTSLLTNISNGIGSIDRATLGNTALAITTAVAAYAIANTTFISKYQKISEQLALDFKSKPTKTETPSIREKITKLKENEGTKDFNLDTPSTFLKDYGTQYNFQEFDGSINDEKFKTYVKDFSTARLEEILISEKFTNEQKRLVEELINLRYDKGYTPGQGTIKSYAGNSAEEFIKSSRDTVSSLFKNLNILLDTNIYKEDFEKSKPIVESFRQESSKLYKLQSEGGSQQEIDTQESLVKKLQTEARKATENITDSQLSISSKIKALEAQKSNLEDSKFGGTKEDADGIERQLKVLRERLPGVIKTLDSFSNPDQFISDRKQEITRKKNSLEISEIKTKGQISTEKAKFVGLREKDGNDFSDPVRQASLQTRESRANQNVAEQKYSLAKETRELLSKATYSEDNRIAYIEALKAEAEALAGVKEATYNTINARQSEKKAIEEFLQVTYDQKVRNFGSFTDSADYGVGKSAKSGNLEDAILYGKLQKTEYELEKFKEILPKLTLNADAAKEKLRQLSDNVVLARLAYLEQSRTLIAERTFAERESVVDFSPFFENQRDIQAKSQVNIERKRDELTTNREQQKETRGAILEIQDPTERANLAIKLTQLETDEIKKKYELELSYLDLAKKKLDTAISQLNSGIGFSAGNATRESENQQYVKGRELEKRLSQAAAPNGGTLTPLGENQERIGLAKYNLGNLRSENEKVYQTISDSFLQIEGTSRESANAFVNLFKGKTSNQLKTDLALFDQQITTAKANPNRESNQVDTVFGKGMDLNYSTVLREAASQIQILKEKEQGLSAALGDLENQRTKMTNDIIRNTIDLKNSNNIASEELNKRNSDLTSSRVDFEKGSNQTIQDRLSNKVGKGRSFSGFLDVENTKFTNSMNSAKKQLEIITKEVTANLKVLQDRETAGASPEELRNLQEKIKAQNIRVANAKLQVIETEQRGIESFLSNLLSFDSGLENLFEGASTKLKEAVELLNQTITQVGELGLGTQFNLNKIVQTRQVAYKDKGQLKTREVLEEFNYDPNKTGSQEEAKIRASVSKRNAEIEAKKRALEFLKTNSQYLSDGSGIESTEQFKAANESTQKLMIEAQSLVGQLGISTTDYKQNIEDITKVLDQAIIDPAKLQVMLNRNQLIQDRKENIQTLELQSTVEQNRERRINNTRGMTDVQRILLGKEPLREDIEAQRQKAELEYDISQEDGNSDIQKARGSLIYKDKTEDLDQQMKNLPQYAERFLFRIKEAVATSANIGGVLEKAIEEGNWTNILKDILSNVIKSLANSFGQDASKGGGNLLSQGLGYLGNLASQGFNALFGGGGGGGSSETGHLPSISDGYNLPNYAEGYNMGSDYPKTTNPDYREPGGNSHLAVIGRDEMVIPPDKIQAVLSHERGVMASTSISNVNNVNNSPTSNNTTNNYSFASAGRKDSFGRPVINDQIDEQRRRKRHE